MAAYQGAGISVFPVVDFAVEQGQKFNRKPERFYFLN